jgi:hypothetical protein
MSYTMGSSGGPSYSDTSWTVTSQVPGIVQQADGNFTKGVTITFRTGGGYVGTVEVPNAQYNEATVKQLIAAKAKELDAVGRSTSL